MRYRGVFAERDRSLDVAMTPMIDVVFMLLIFFVWTASFHVPELVLPSSLVSQSAGVGSQAEMDPDLQDLERIVVRIGWSGKPNWVVNDTPVSSLEAVADRFMAVARIEVDLPVLVDPAPAVPLGHVIDVYDLARRAGFVNVQFATEAPASN